MYRNSTDVRRCIIEKQEAVGRGGRQLKKPDWDYVVEWLEYELVYNLLNNKNIDKDSYIDTTIARLIRDYDLTGNRYLFILRNEDWTPVGVQVLDPRYLTVMSDEYGNVKWFVYTIRWDVQYLERIDVIRDKNESDPTQEVYGYGIMESLVNDVLADHEASRSNHSFFKNNMIPAHIIVLDDDVSEEEARIIVEQMKLQFAWWKNNNKWAVLKWVKNIITTWTTNYRDMEFLNLRKFTTEKICTAFGVPKLMLWLSEWVNYSNAEMMYKEFIQNTIVPLETRLARMFNVIIDEVLPWRKFEFIDSHLDEQGQKMDIYIKAIENWLMTIDEAREEMWYTPFDTEESKKPLIKKTLVFLEDSGAVDMPFSMDEE